MSRENLLVFLILKIEQDDIQKAFDKLPSLDIFDQGLLREFRYFCSVKKIKKDDDLHRHMKNITKRSFQGKTFFHKYNQNSKKKSTSQSYKKSSSTTKSSKTKESPSSTLHYITDSDDVYTKNSPSPTKFPPTSHDNINPIINQTHHDSRSTSSQSSDYTNMDPFNRDYDCQYEQEFIDGMEQQQALTPYNSDDLHEIYGQGAYDEYHHH